VLRVRDTGSGIPYADLPHIFERFYVVDRSRSREHGGTGLGLSIARHLVELHGGTITAESIYGDGAAFECLLPLGSAPAIRTLESKIKAT
jgi:signal transduction histidine kinase